MEFSVPVLGADSATAGAFSATDSKMATYKCALGNHQFKNHKHSRWFDSYRSPVTDEFPCVGCRKKLETRAANLSSELEQEKRVTEKLRKELEAEKKKGENFRLWGQANKRYADNLIPVLEVLEENEATVEILSQLLEDEKQANARLRRALDNSRKDNERLTQANERLTTQIRLEQEKQKTMDREIEKLKGDILLEQTKVKCKDKDIKLLKERNRMIERDRRQAVSDADRFQEEAKQAKEEAKEAFEEAKEAYEVAKRAKEEAKRAYEEAKKSDASAMNFRDGILRCAKSYERDVGAPLPNDLQVIVNKAKC